MTKGIHHITAIASDAQKTYEFYSKVLGLRLVKRTVNQDDTGTYHLFFGDKTGEPGMDLTFFIFLPSTLGIPGNGLVTTISLAVPEDSLGFWQERLTAKKIAHTQTTRFEKKRIRFSDSDGQQLELVGVPHTDKAWSTNVWIPDDIPEQAAIRNFYSATLQVEYASLLDPILTHVFGYKKIGTSEQTDLYTVEGSQRGNLLEIQSNERQEYGTSGAGTVHHIAYRAKDKQEQQEMSRKLEELGVYHTEVIDRFYFQSVYFRTPAGILFEIATEGPGFTADENEDELGKHLALPPFLENQRTSIEAELPPFVL